MYYFPFFRSYRYMQCCLVQANFLGVAASFFVKLLVVNFLTATVWWLATTAAAGARANCCSGIPGKMRHCLPVNHAAIRRSKYNSSVSWVTLRRKELYRYVKLNFVSDGVFPSFILIVVVILNSKSGVEDFFCQFVV